MFGNFKKAAESAQAIAQELRRARELLEAEAEAGAGTEELQHRVDRIELEIDKKLARVEALLDDAENKYRLARAAEERARHREKRAEELQEELAELDAEGMEDVPEDYLELLRRHAGGGGGQGVQPVPNGMAAPESAESIAKRHKFGG